MPQVRLDKDLENKLQRICMKGSVEFRVAVRSASNKPHTLSLSKKRLQLKQGWNAILSWDYCEHITISIDNWTKSAVFISLDQLAMADSKNAIRCSLDSVEDRDMLVLVLRYMVSKHSQMGNQ